MSPQDQIDDSFFSILELLIVLIILLMVIVMIAVHAYASSENASSETKAYSLTTLAFMALTAGITCTVHFVIFTVGRQIESAGFREFRYYFPLNGHT